MNEDLSNIKCGDILVAYYPETKCMSYKRNYIIFIASGEVSIPNEEYYLQSTKSASIGILAAINLGGKFFFRGYDNNKLSTIGFTIFDKNPNYISILRKPTFFEMINFISTMKEHGLKYNRKTKNIEKL